jgi:lysozyme
MQARLLFALPLLLAASAWLPACDGEESAVAGANLDDPVIPEAPAATEESAPKQCAEGPTVEGVDVSYYQPHVDWIAAKKAGISFAFLRVSDGASFLDPELAPGWAAAGKAGIVRGPYQFFRPGEDAVAQADLLIATLRAQGGLQPGDLPPVLDIEVTDDLPAATIRAGMGRWLARVEAAFGRRPMIYTSPGFWDGLGAEASFARYPLWVAHWDTACPGVPGAWPTWTFWQTTDHAEIPGIPGSVDRDRFNGTLADLRAFAGAADPAPTRPRAPPKPRPAPKPRARAHARKWPWPAAIPWPLPWK